MPFKDPKKRNEYHNDWNKVWRKKNPDSAKLKDKKDKVREIFGISYEEYCERLKRQNNVCALCRKPFDFSTIGGKPALDHNHSTNELRDFLHSSCNIALGLFKDSSEICRFAAEYLESHQKFDAMVASELEDGLS